MDVHREFAQVAVWEDGLVRQAGQITLTLSTEPGNSSLARMEHLVMVLAGFERFDPNWTP